LGTFFSKNKVFSSTFKNQSMRSGLCTLISDYRKEGLKRHHKLSLIRY